MPDITVDIVIPDANVAEVSAATGATTKAQFQDWVRDRVIETVKGHRRQQVGATESAKVDTAKEAERVAVQTAVDAVDTDVVLG